MHHTRSSCRTAIALMIALAGLLATPGIVAAQTVTGNATAARVTTLGLLGGTTTVLADTGALAGTSDARDASLTTASVPPVLAGEVLHAVTLGWPDQVASVASLASLTLTVGGTGITADLVMARARVALGGGISGVTTIDNLTIGGVPVLVTGEPNQTVAIPGGQVVINEQTLSADGTTVNALHAQVSGAADVVVASATAAIR